MNKISIFASNSLPISPLSAPSTSAPVPSSSKLSESPLSYSETLLTEHEPDDGSTPLKEAKKNVGKKNN